MKWFAEMEFWFALIKVLAIVTFLVVGTVSPGSGQPLDGNTTGFHLVLPIMAALSVCCLLWC
ncbi:hypothetical protein ACVXHB_05300 [Escherichia coli]